MMKILAGSNLNSRLENSDVSALDKGIPFGFQFRSDFTLEPKLNVLDEALHFPLLLLKESALAYNLAAMAQWCAANKFLIAPHGKTTMTPRIFERQIEAGAWAITVATASQAAVCAAMGIRRILVANQVVGRANVRSLAAIMKSDPALDLLCLIDSVDGIELLSTEWQATGVDRPIGVLVEVGHHGWRTGARTLESALQLCAEISKHPQTLSFRGIEGFEGLAHASASEEEVRQAKEFLEDIAAFAKALQSLSAARNEPLLLSVGGSGFLDAVWEFSQQMQGPFQIVIRSGCYVTHDHGYYAQKLTAAHERADRKANLPLFRPALELWSHVQSKPEEGLAILNFGKRDCPYDVGLPSPLFAQNRNHSEPKVDLKKASITHSNDQHAYLSGPGIEHLRIGDQVCCGISHPCTAFDKWRILPVVDDSYNVIDFYRTYF
jgi:D-serine dehydratase